MGELEALLGEVRACRRCDAALPLGANPLLQASADARILIAGQAPGRKAHTSGIPFDDASGERLRDWLGVGPALFYDPARIAILPLGFCYPGRGKSGDLPPRRECAPAWRERLLAAMPKIELTLLLGRYAIDYHLGATHASLSAAVSGWRKHWPAVLPLPHPSPRNNRWLRENPWFARELLPRLRARVRQLTGD